MAYWNRKTIKGRSYVYVYTRKGGRQSQVKPRRLYKHLDAAPDHNIEAWVRQWEVQYESPRVTPDHVLHHDDTLTRYIADYRTFLKDTQQLAPGTYQKYASLLTRFAVPYFLSQDTPLRDPQQWPGISVRLLDYLQAKQLSPALISEINLALRGFYAWLRDEGIVQTDVALRLRNARRRDERTPLQHTLDPEQVLRFVASQSREVQILALCGYFFSLRPQETFGLKPSDFVAGTRATEKDCGRAMSAADLYSRLAVNVTRQRTSTGQLPAPKAYSRGYVSCFDEKAAAKIVEILNASKSMDTAFFARDNRAMFRVWKAAVEGDEVFKDLTLKDLRRASIYWLGHFTSLTPIQVMKHARHKEFETTSLYLRRPEEEMEPTPKKFDLGA